MGTLDGQIAIVTGAARSIGKGIARRFLQDGAKVWLSDVDGDELAKTAAELGAIGPVGASVVDVTRRDQVERLAEEVVETWGGIDVLVNNAGISAVKRFFEVTDADWDRVQDVNLKGTFLCTQAVTRKMVDLGTPGVVINIASVNGLRGQPALGSYGASKAGIINFTKTIALELGKHGIRVNAICPATTRTEMSEKVNWDQILMDELAAHTALGRLGTIDDIAGVAAFLAGPDAAFITGTEIVVDGGLLARQIVTPVERLLGE